MAAIITLGTVSSISEPQAEADRFPGIGRARSRIGGDHTRSPGRAFLDNFRIAGNRGIEGDEGVHPCPRNHCDSIYLLSSSIDTNFLVNPLW